MTRCHLLLLIRVPLVSGLAVAALLATAPAAWAQRNASRPVVSGPSAPGEATLEEEQVYRLLRRQLVALMASQDEARAAQGAYARQFGRRAPDLAFHPARGVTVQLTFANASGWAAEATHAGLPGKSCVLWVGMVRPDRRPATAFDRNAGNEAEVVCDLVP